MLIPNCTVPYIVSDTQRVGEEKRGQTARLVPKQRQTF